MKEIHNIVTHKFKVGEIAICVKNKLVACPKKLYEQALKESEEVKDKFFEERLRRLLELKQFFLHSVRIQDENGLNSFNEDIEKE